MGSRIWKIEAGAGMPTGFAPQVDLADARAAEQFALAMAECETLLGLPPETLDP